jgi:glutathione synthase/RimK-type ligase-like ATP-grasp enzyme
MKYLIIDKVQPITKDKIPYATQRIIEELDKKNIPHSLAYLNELEFEFINGETVVKAKGADITKYTHILFRGHDLHSEIEYQYKRYIVEYIDRHNLNNPDNKVLVQNSNTIKKLPYYNKIYLALFCSYNNIPYFNTYYRTDGNYLAHRDVLNAFPLIMKEYSGANRIEKVMGKEKIKKNVFKINNEDGYRDKELKKLDYSRMFIQEFSGSKTDYRIFLSKGKIVGGWKREATEGFMTVKRGKYSPYNNPGGKIRELSENVTQKLEADFLAVDIMEIKNKPLLQEISLHPGFKAYETKIEGNDINLAEIIINSF